MGVIDVVDGTGFSTVWGDVAVPLVCGVALSEECAAAGVPCGVVDVICGVVDVPCVVCVVGAFPAVSDVGCSSLWTRLSPVL